jgi:hypothetical protein
MTVRGAARPWRSVVAKLEDGSFVCGG